MSSPPPRITHPLPIHLDKTWSPPKNDTRWFHPILGYLWGAHETLNEEGYWRQAEDVSLSLQSLEKLPGFPLP